MQLELFDTLARKFNHERDNNIVFDEPTHKYTVLTEPNTFYTSVTTINHKHFAEFDADAVIRNIMKGKNWNENNKYWGMTPEQIKKQWADNGKAVSGSGTKMHLDIECFMNYVPPGLEDKQYITHKDLLDYHLQLYPNAYEESEEWAYFLNYVASTPDYIPYRAEWSIYDEDLKVAGQIDMIYYNADDGTLSIFDWKRAKDIQKNNNFNKFAITEAISHIPDTNFWHYSLQLNTYKEILERKYGLKIRDLFLVKLHPENRSKNFELIECADLSPEVKELFTKRTTPLQKQPTKKPTPTIDEDEVASV
jgi:hypothetical protein